MSTKLNYSPRCYQCEKKAARKAYEHIFCSKECAAQYALGIWPLFDGGEGAGKEWCPRCQAWEEFYSVHASEDQIGLQFPETADECGQCGYRARGDV